jgi:signal recognition particle subunit SRP54
MTGQDAVNVAEEFARRLSIDGVILTKLDGDARGGAALSVRAVTGAPIKFVSVGERLEALEPFHPDRMASRILGMGDVLTLVERAQEAMDQEKAQELARKVLEDQFTLEDFRSQLLHVRKMGPLQQLIELIPGLQDTSGMQYVDEDFDEKDMDHMVAVVNSMTMEERLHPSVLTGSRKRRIAKGSGMTVQDVNLVLKQYRQVAQMMKGMLSGEGGPGAVPPTAAKKIRIPARFRH